MNRILWVLQVLGALIYIASGYMKMFMFEKISADIPTFGALPKSAWQALGGLELACAVGLIIPGLLHWRPSLTVLAAGALAIESLIFIWVHVQYREAGAIAMSGALGLTMAFVAYGRGLLLPLT